jgi:hypothetical protein
LTQEKEQAMRFANKQFSTATLNPEHLLECALDYIDDATAVAEIKKVLADPQNNEWSASEHWNEVVFNILEQKSEYGYYFGSTEGNGSDIGWWPLQDHNIPENWNASKKYCLQVVLPPESSPTKVMVVECGDNNGWSNRAQFSNKEWVLNPFLKAEHITELCRYEDIDEAMRINRECDILADMLEYALEQDDNEFMENFSVWFEAHGFSTRAKLFNL